MRLWDDLALRCWRNDWCIDKFRNEIYHLAVFALDPMTPSGNIVCDQSYQMGSLDPMDTILFIEGCVIFVPKITHMTVRLQSILIGVATGILFTISWVIFIDAQLLSHDKFVASHILPPLFATIAAVAINLVTLQNVTSNPWAKVWLLVWITAQCICVGASIFILSTEYSIDDNYAGVSMLMQTILCMFASFIFFAGKSKINSIHL